MQTVLIVDDEVLIRIDLAEQVRSAGFAVIEASTAQEALEILKTGGSVALVITDIRMPGDMDGLELAASIRLETPDIKVMIISGHVPTLKLATIADAALAKPVSPQRLLEEVTRLLGRAT